MRKVKFFSFWLLLTVGLATVVFNACKEDDPADIAVTAISLDKTTLTLGIGENYTLTATIMPDNATNKTITWTSSDNTKATVVNGKVTAVATGTATITAKAGDKTATCVITVSTSTVAVTGISLNKTTLTLAVGENQTLIEAVTPANATNKDVTWTSSDNTKATVVNGKVTAVTAGMATITAKAGDKTATCMVTVTNPIVVQSISLNETEITLITGQSANLVATVVPAEATVTWTSSTSAATVNSSGRVTASSYNTGTTTITAKAGDKTATCKVTVIADPALTADPGVVIDGIKWATRNVESPGYFAATPQDYGLLYQWNRRTGWNTYELVIGPTMQNPSRQWNTSPSLSSAWESSNDPCPSGWRLPTAAELESLSNFHIEEVYQNNRMGHIFGSGDATIFLTTPGWRPNDGQGNLLGGAGRNGTQSIYWSSTEDTKDYRNAYSMDIMKNDAYMSESHKATGACIRCVAK